MVEAGNDRSSFSRHAIIFLAEFLILIAFIVS